MTVPRTLAVLACALWTSASAFAAPATAPATKPAAWAQPPITYAPELTVLDFKPPGRVALLNDGSLACVANGRYLVSRDDGGTWEPVGEVSSGPGPAISGGMLVQTKQGALVLVYSDHKGVRLERKDNLPLPGAALHVWAARSTDGGKTWADHARLIDGYCGATIDIICTRDNRIVLPLQDIRYDPARNVTVVFTSADDGKTWQKSADLDIGGHGLEDGAFEGTLAQRADDSLLLFLRTTRDRIWYSLSHDDGRSWTLPTSTDIKASNSPSFLLALQSGRLALVFNPLHPTDAKAWPRLELNARDRTEWPRRVKPRYAERPDNHYREELCLMFSDDGGVTWTSPTVIARQPRTRLSYAYMFERRPGEVWLNLRGQWLRIDEAKFAGTEVPVGAARTGTGG